MTLSDYLKDNSITQVEFAKKIGRSQTAVSAYCNGTMLPPRKTALKIVEVTKGAVTLEDLWHTKIA